MKNFNIKRIPLKLKNIKVLKKIFAKMSYIREFELRAYENRLNKKFETLIYLCLGQESIYSSISEALPKSDANKDKKKSEIDKRPTSYLDAFKIALIK